MQQLWWQRRLRPVEGGAVVGLMTELRLPDLRLENGRISAALRRKGLKPETRFRADKAAQMKRRR